MTHWTFDSTAESWSGTSFAWDGTDGDPTAGCMKRSGAAFSTALCSITGLSIATTSGDDISFECKFSGTLNSLGGGAIVMYVKDSGGTVLGSLSGAIAGFSSPDTWLSAAGHPVSNGTVASIEVQLIGSGNSVTSLWFDSVYLNETPPAPAVIPQTRYLGIAADNANIYRASITGGTLTLDYMALTAPGTAVETFTFGTCDYADPDTYTYAIYPVTVADLELYLYGRDANGVQVQYNDLNGTLGWVDAGPGTATWATSKFCVALMPSPVAPRNLIAAFADDDIYTSVAPDDNIWTKTGDAGTALRCAGRVTTEFDRFLVAGQGTAQTYFSQNYGASFTNAFSGLAGTVNGFEVSR